MGIINWKEFLLPYEQTVNELCIKFESIKSEYDFLGIHSPIEYVEGRVKKINSILEKANKKGVSLDLIEDKIEDIAGIRIMCRFVEDIETVVNLIRQRNGYDLTILKERDYITNTKPSGYRSYHILFEYTVMTAFGLKKLKGEVQIRTLAMNFWARIEHSLKYKYNGNMPTELQKRLISTAEASFQLDKEMSTIRGEIMQAQKIVQIKTDLIDQIMANIQSLYVVAKLENINELNKQFLELFNEGDIERLQEFNKQLKVMAQVYKVNHVD